MNLNVESPCLHLPSTRSTLTCHHTGIVFGARDGPRASCAAGQAIRQLHSVQPQAPIFFCVNLTGVWDRRGTGALLESFLISKAVGPGGNHVIKKKRHTKESRSRLATLLPAKSCNQLHYENKTPSPNLVSHVLRGQELSLLPKERKTFYVKTRISLVL